MTTQYGPLHVLSHNNEQNYSLSLSIYRNIYSVLWMNKMTTIGIQMNNDLMNGNYVTTSLNIQPIYSAIFMVH